MDKYAKQALLEYNSAETAAHPGGVNGRNFWNLNSTQFTFAPTFQFPRAAIIVDQKYRYTARDKNGKTYTFDSDSSMASLAPIWGELPTGVTTLKVEVIDKNDNPLFVIGARTFFKCDPFPGREALPPKKLPYRECAIKSLEFVFNDPMVRHWLTHGLPQADYPHNVYPAKTISSIILAMIAYSDFSPENAEQAIQLARNAADYMLSLSFEEGHPMAYLPPTYSFKNLDAEAVNKVAPAAWECRNTNMMIYPVYAADAYLKLFDKTGDKKYFDAALRIAEFYRDNVLPCGSWYLVCDCETGKPLSDNICMDFRFVDFFRSLYEKTGNEEWQKLEVDHFNYILGVCLKTYNWEGQFEDIKASSNYTNLTHFTAGKIINYISNYRGDDENLVAEAKDLMRYIEDQFVVWGEYPVWDPNSENKILHSPAGLEQYFCYWPIDASTSTIISVFIDMYKLTKDRLYLEKAMALGDSYTRTQDDNGMVPTFWIGENCAEGRVNYWINCQIHGAFHMLKLADIIEQEGIE